MSKSSSFKESTLHYVQLQLNKLRIYGKLKLCKINVQVQQQGHVERHIIKENHSF